MTRGPEEAAAELRELIREANGAVKDLRQVLREGRQMIVDGSQAAAAAVAESAGQELDRYSRHLHKEMNKQTADFKAAVEAARVKVIDLLKISELKIIRGADGVPSQLRLVWADGGNFYPDILLPDGPEMEQTGT